MALFTTIPDTDLDANSPLTEPLMLALRDNPVAIAQGDASAPNISNTAFADNTITWAKLNKTGASFNLNGGDITTSLATYSSYLVPKGIYMCVVTSANANIKLGATYSGGFSSGCIISDGINVLINTTVDTATVYLKKVS